MDLYIGGKAQGKLALAQDRYKNALLCTGEAPSEEITCEIGQPLIWDQFHVFMKKALADGKEPAKIWEEVLEILNRFPNLIVISDEIGNGIVPMDPMERRYREETGRILCKLAAQANTVERVFAGIPQKIK